MKETSDSETVMNLKLQQVKAEGAGKIKCKVTVEFLSSDRKSMARHCCC